MSIDFERPARDLADPNKLVILVKAHLWVERRLNSCLEANLENPNALALDRMSFHHKVNLAESLGILGGTWLAAVRRLNAVRNEAAHRLEWELSDADVHALVDAVAPGGFEDVDIPHFRLVLSLAYLVGYVEAQAAISRYVADNTEVLAANRYLRRYHEKQGHAVDSARALADQVAPVPPAPRLEDIRGGSAAPSE